MNENSGRIRLTTFFLVAAGAVACDAFPAGSLERAACHGKLRQWGEAAAVYREHLSTHGDSLPAATGLVEALLQMERSSLVRHNVAEAVEHAMEASKELSKLLGAHPDEPAVLKLQASVLANIEKNPQAAERTLRRITQLAPRDGDAWSMLGSFYLDRQRTEEGIQSFESAAALDPENRLYRAGLARAYAAAGRTAEAEKAFAAALEGARQDTAPPVFLWYGDFLASLQRYDPSGEAYSRVIAADPDDGEAWLRRASVELKAGRFREAEKDAREALKHGAGEREAQTLLVSVYRELGENAKAAASAAAVERASDEQEEGRAKWRRARTWLDRADGLMQAERFSEALPLYVNVTEEVPGYADAWFSAAICYAHGGEEKRAEQSFRAYLRLQPLSADGHSALGLLLLSQRRVAEARAELAEALRLDPAAAEAKEALEALDARTK